MGHKQPAPVEKMAAILAEMRDNPPFIQLCAEACGVNRKTIAAWLMLGEQGDPRYEDFTTQVRAIRAKYMLNASKELLAIQDNPGSRETAKHKAWLLQKMDRSIFEPPKEIFEKRAKKPEDETPEPRVANEASLQQAQDILGEAPEQRH